MNPFDWDVPWIVLYIALFCGVMVRANATYWLGRGVITGLRRSPRVEKKLGSPAFSRAADFVERYGAPIVAISFATVGFQSLVLLAAGTTKMSMPRFLPAVTAGCLLWALIYSTIGMVGFQMVAWSWDRSPALTLLSAVLIAAAVAFYVRLARRRRGTEA